MPGTTFGFSYTCTNGATGTFSIADGESFSTAAPIPAFTTCTITETGQPPVGAAYGWDPVEFTVSVDATTAGNSVTFTIPTDPAGAQVNVTNPITPRLGAVRVAKVVTGVTAGLSPTAPPFTITLDCGPSRVYQLDVPAGGSAIQADIPVGSVCTATETAPSGGLVDASFAWGDPTIVPAAVTVTGPTPVDVQVQNPIVRVTAPVQLVKTYTGPQGVIDPARTYPVTWSCTYGGAVVAGGTVAIVADPTGITVADAVPLTSVCTATEGAARDPLARPGVPLGGPGHHRDDGDHPGPEHDDGRQHPDARQRHGARAQAGDRRDRGLREPRHRRPGLHAARQLHRAGGSRDPPPVRRRHDRRRRRGADHRQHRVDVLRVRGHPEPGPAARRLVRVGRRPSSRRPATSPSPGTSRCRCSWPRTRSCA